MSREYPYKTTPRPHQRDALRFLKDRKYAGLFMDQGTGKTKVILDEAGWLFLNRGLNALLVYAPEGVQTNWIEDEIPIHMSDEVPYTAIEWVNGLATRPWYKEQFMEALQDKLRLLIVAMNTQSLITPKGKDAARAILERRKAMMVIDESTDIKSPGAKRTKSARALGRRAAYRRILAGLPDPEGPVDLYSQLSFLSPHIVGNSAQAFRAEYCEFEKRFFPNGPAGGVDIVVGHRNIPRLQAIVANHCFRVTKDVLDLPPKQYTKWYLDLSREQRKMYDELLDEWRTQFPDDPDDEVNVQQAIVRDLRLQQIASGYAPTENPEIEEPVRIIPGPQPRLDALAEAIMKHPGPTLIWTRYKMDCALVEERLHKVGASNTAVYSGDVDKVERSNAKRAFQAGEVDYLILTSAAAKGLTLHRAEYNIFYSHWTSLLTRVQAEDRSHRDGLRHSVLYIDIVARDTVDVKMVRRYREKDDTARDVIGDNRRTWV